MTCDQIRRCYGCGSLKLEPLFTFAGIASCGAFLTDGNSAPRSDISLKICTECNLTQASHNLPLDELYSEDYGYRSSLNPSMVQHLEEKAERLKGIYKTDTVIDVGANDGTFLKNFIKSKKIGVDPSVSCEELALGSKHINSFFPSEETNNLASNSFDLICAISMFYDLPDIGSFVEEVKRLLRDDGIFHIELSYVQMMYANNAFDTICHEHLEYYSILSLQKIFALHDLKICEFGFNQINGGSLWMDISKVRTESDGLAFFIAAEQAMGINDDTAFTKMMRRVDEIKEETLALLQRLNDQGHSVHALGASTKGNMTLQYFDVGQSQIRKIHEVNQMKFGKRTPGSNIPIIQEFSELADAYFVLPWHFKNQFLKEQRYEGKKLIFPFPSLDLRV